MKQQQVTFWLPYSSLLVKLPINWGNRYLLHSLLYLTSYSEYTPTEQVMLLSKHMHHVHSQL